MRELIIEAPDNFGKTLKAEKVNTKIIGELVRCKDCVHYQEWGNSKICMRLRSYYRDNPPDWFCADGKRR